MQRLILALALPLVLVLLGCEGSISPTAPDETLVAQQPATGVGTVSSLGATNAASAPISFPIFAQIVGLNPCTGLAHDITFTGTAWWQPHNNNEVLRMKRTITTSDGFEGRGSSTDVWSYSGTNLYKLTANDMLKHPSGAKIRAHFVFLLDSGTGTVRVDKSVITCVRP